MAAFQQLHSLAMVLCLACVLIIGAFAHTLDTPAGDDLYVVSIQCEPTEMVIEIQSEKKFQGMIYPKGLLRNSGCFKEYPSGSHTAKFSLPLHSCNTMSEIVSHGLEYFNTIIFQRHSRLITSEGRSFDVRCRYEAGNTTITSAFDVGYFDLLSVSNSAELPDSLIHIYVGDPKDRKMAKNVKIGETLTLVISINEQDVYGIKVTNCSVGDGLGETDLLLIDEDGCSVDDILMGPFTYEKNMTSAQVTFTAHKFPTTSAVYYHCHTLLCLKAFGQCKNVPPFCPDSHDASMNYRRRQRRHFENIIQGIYSVENNGYEDFSNRSLDVYYGLHVQETETKIESTGSEVSCITTGVYIVLKFGAIILLGSCVLITAAMCMHLKKKTCSVDTTPSTNLSRLVSHSF